MARHPKFIEAVGLFNEQRFWESHEALEIPWKEDPTPAREFYQGLIHCAAALHHFRLATTRREGRHGEHEATEEQVARHLQGARGQWEKAQRRLGAFRPRHAGVDVDAFLERMKEALSGLDEGRAAFRAERVPKLALED